MTTHLELDSSEHQPAKSSVAKKRRWYAGIASSMVIAAATAGAGPAAAEPPFTFMVKNDANAREAPSTSAAVLGKIFAGERVQLLCQDAGETVHGSAVWDLVQYQVDGTGGLTKMLWMHDNNLSTGRTDAVSGVRQGHCPAIRATPGSPIAAPTVTDPPVAQSSNAPTPAATDPSEVPFLWCDANTRCDHTSTYQNTESTDWLHIDSAAGFRIFVDTQTKGRRAVWQVKIEHESGPRVRVLNLHITCKQVDNTGIERRDDDCGQHDLGSPTVPEEYVLWSWVSDKVWSKYLMKQGSYYAVVTARLQSTERQKVPEARTLITSVTWTCNSTLFEGDEFLPGRDYCHF